MVAPEAYPHLSERFVVERRLGSGGFGSVFYAIDRERNRPVAIKRLERVDPASIYRFKQEFRALADVVHPNLVRLFELYSQPAGWSFTMEWVDGVPFDRWACGLEGSVDSASRQSTELDPSPLRHDATQSGVSVADTHEVPERRSGPQGFDEARLRDALRQLATGVSALHAEGILHRDLKPSNVLVDRNGRVVILDFGMVATGVVDSHESIDGARMGTPAYMSPEQARGAPLTVASDWYTLGLMLYEVLLGNLPFQGNVGEILTAKAMFDAPDLRVLRPDLPADLIELCTQLLQRDPRARPSGEQILARLDAPRPASSRTSAVFGHFVGRDSEHARLQAAFELAKERRTVVAHVYGPSGFGKSTLVRHFLRELSLRDEVVVLTGRCYERESVPFKALDDLVDHLYQTLRRMRPLEAAAYMPRHAPALVRLFPTLGRLDFMTQLPERLLPADAHELRRKAFGALREMFTRITDSRPLVLFIDDAQWGDPDSAALFRDLLAPPDVPPLLLIVGYRGDQHEQSELLRTLRTPRAADSAWESVDIPLQPLPEAEASRLAELLLDLKERDGALARSIAVESAGSPFFVAELARRTRSNRDVSEQISLMQVVAERVKELPEDTRAILDLLSCSERPLSPEELRQGCGLALDGIATALDRLREEHLITASTRRSEASFEVLHDKVRLAVRHTLDDDRLRERHGQLASALVAAPDIDPETLAHHFAAAGDASLAMEWTEVAADRAAEGVAFDHGVTLYRQALELGGDDKLASVGVKLALALVRAGRGSEAAQVYLRVARVVDADTARQMRQAAAEQYLRSGLVEEALATFGPLLEEAHLALPATPTRALASLLWERTWLALGGHEFQWNESPQRPALQRIDFCWSIGTGLAGIDLVRSARYHVISLRLSLKSGEPYRIARALSMEAIMKGLESTKGVARAKRHAERALEIAQRIDNPHALGWAKAASAVVAWGETDLPRCVELCDSALDHLRQRSLETFREVGSVEVWFALNTLFLLGKLEQVAERAPACAREAEARGDRYTQSTVRAYILPLLWASRDDVAEGRREANAALAVWPADAWYHQHWAWLRAMCFLDLYEGQPRLVLERARKHRETMRRTMQLRIRTLRTELNYLEARGALGMIAESDDRRGLERLVEQRAQQLLDEHNRLSDVYAETLRAGLTALNKPDKAEAQYLELQRSYAKLQMPMHVAACQWRRGERLGEQGQVLIAEARRTLSELGVAAPERWVQMLVP